MRPRALLAKIARLLLNKYNNDPEKLRELHNDARKYMNTSLSEFVSDAYFEDKVTVDNLHGFALHIEKNFTELSEEIHDELDKLIDEENTLLMLWQSI